MEYLQRQNGTYNDRPIESRIWSIGAIFNDLNLDVKVTELLYMLSVLCAQLTRDLFAIASFLVLHWTKQTSYADTAVSCSKSRVGV